MIPSFPNVLKMCFPLAVNMPSLGGRGSCRSASSRCPQAPLRRVSKRGGASLLAPSMSDGHPRASRSAPVPAAELHRARAPFAADESAEALDAQLGDRRSRRRSGRAKFLLDEKVVAGVLGAADELHKLLVMRDDDKLEVRLVAPTLDDLIERSSERLDVGTVEVRRRLVEGEDAAVDAERLGERQPDHERGEHLLARRAAAAHVEHRVALLHHDSVRLLASAVGRLAVVLSLDLDAIDVGALVRLVPQLSDRLVDIRHLGLVELHQRRVERLVVPVEVVDGHRDRLVFDELLAVLAVDVLVHPVGELLLR
mmetsp:Transcript_13480/g.34566  ORF Transcript_13480/g.34566 Transcript_13480/m.34566 type:complete len:311 (-) Transcript_13480:1131-2063(-)